jgi:hypothetical protein
MSEYAVLMPWGAVIVAAVAGFVLGRLWNESKPQTFPMPEPAGKDGVPGLFSIEVTGVSSVDLPKIQAAYLGK